MDRSRKDFTPSTSPTPKFEIYGNDENQLSEDLASKLQNSNNKRSPVTDFKDTVRRMKTFDERNKTLDFQEQPRMSKSFSFDSVASRLNVTNNQEVDKNILVDDSNLQPYDPINNYLSPRPKFLRYSPDRHNEIVARQEHVNRFIKSHSFDYGTLFLKKEEDDEEVESSVECSVGDSGEIIDESVGYSENEDKHEVEDLDDDDVDVDVEEEVFDDNVEDNGWSWSLNSFWQYLFVLITLIAITLSIVFINMPKEASVDEAYDSVMLMMGNLSNSEIDRVYDEWDKGIVVISSELLEMQQGTIKDVCRNEDEALDFTGNDDPDETDVINVAEDERTKEEDIVIVASKGTETVEKETYSHFNDKPEVVNMNMNGPDGIKIEGIKNYGYLIKLNGFDTKVAGFIGISVLILVILRLLWRSMMKILKNKVSNNESFSPKRNLFVVSDLEYNFSQSYGNNYLSLTNSNASSSNRTIFSNYETSTGDSPSIGSFTIETKIIKKPKSKTPEVTISKVRRSSRIHNRSFISSPSSFNVSN